MINETHKEEIDFLVKHSDKNLPEVLRLFAEMKVEQCAINSVVFNEATAKNESILDEPQPLYEDYDTELKSEVELCENPNCEDGIVGYDPWYKHPIYCQVCDKHN